MGRKVAVGLQGSQVIRVGYEGLNQGFDRVGGALVHGVVVVEVPLHASILHESVPLGRAPAHLRNCPTHRYAGPWSIS